MATVAPEVIDKAARKSLERKPQGPTSHGRGGAGKLSSLSYPIASQSCAVSDYLRSQRFGSIQLTRKFAGNFGSSAKDKPVDPTSLETPTIKTKVYTTGRGGQGNMAKNDSPEEARRAQDVTAYVSLFSVHFFPLRLVNSTTPSAHKQHF